MNTTDFLIVVDFSYWLHSAASGAVALFTYEHPDEARQWIKPPEECDQSNLPDLLNCATFKRVLKKHAMRKLERIDWIAKSNFQNELDAASKIDILFAADDRLKNNFRLSLYPTYKMQRKLVKRSYKLYNIMDYIRDVIFKEENVEGRFGYHFIKVPGAEGDDVIATTLLNFKDRYSKIMLIASDHDYLQIDGIAQFNLEGKQIVRDLGGTIVSAPEYLLGKILMGDKSDNICQVFKKCGPKTALKLVKDKEMLKQRLAESQDAQKQFQLNKKIIAFSEIPEDLSKSIIQAVNVEIYDRRAINENVNWKDFMTL